MSAEPADPRVAVVASVLSDAHFGDSSEDVCDGFRNLARHALAAADAVITPLAEVVETIVAAIVDWQDEVHWWGDRLPEDGLAWFIAQRLRAAVLSPPPSDEHAAYADPIEGGRAGYQGACHDCDWRGTFFENFGIGCGAKSGAQADARLHAEEIEHARAGLSPPDTPTEYEQVGWFHEPTNQFTNWPPPANQGWEPVFRRVRDENEKP